MYLPQPDFQPCPLPSHLPAVLMPLVLSGIMPPALEEIARLIEDAKEALERGDVDEARVCLTKATVSADPDQEAKYEAWKAARGGPTN